MAGYYVLSIDLFTNAFSFINNRKKIKFTLKKQGADYTLAELKPADMIVVYNKKPACYYTSILCVESTAGDSIVVFKEFEIGEGIFCSAVSENVLENNELTAISEEQYSKIFSTMLESISARYTNQNKSIEQTDRVKGGKNLLLYGVPGSGKSWEINKICRDEMCMERVVFHPDYTYSDFVGQIIPRLNAENNLEYVFDPGPFTRIVRKAEHDPGKMYYLIIEEINRGNAPAIFGDIFQLLDRKNAQEYPGSEDESVYGISNYDIARIVYDGDTNHPVRIPSNLCIVATMNTSDQNIFTLDTAFQRRWKMRHISNKFKDGHAMDIIVDTKILWGDFAKVVNKLIIEVNADITGAGDKRLGAYFVTRNELSREEFSEKVLKYLWDDAFKMDKFSFFNDKFDSLEEIIEVYQTSSNDDPLEDILNEDVYQKMLESNEI